MRCDVRALARLLAINAGAALLVLLVFGNVTWRTPWRDAIEAYGVSLLFSNCIGALIATTMPRLAPGVMRRFVFPFDWAVLVLAIAAMGIAGSVMALAILGVVGFVPANEVWPWFVGSLRISLIVTLTFGILATIMEMLRARLDATTVALRTKERDEAEARRLAAEAQLAALESRVQPHFLFNTLNSIAALIHDDPESAERMTAQLAALMRSSLDEQRALVPLDDELRTVRNYLEIERVRFGERLRYEIDLDDRLRASQVPRLSVQTLVENSVKYAVSPRRSGGTIAVRAAADDGLVRVVVEDDGPGFDTTALPAGHGIALVRARLGMLFGDAASLTIESRAAGTTAVLSVPATHEPRRSGHEPRATSHQK